MSESYAKFLRDIADCQRPCGQIPAIVPTSGWGYNWGSGPAWDVAFFRLAYAEYYYYGRTDILDEHYESLKKYLSYLSTYEDKEGLVENGLGDWNYPKKIQFAVCPTRLTSSCYYLQMLRLLAEISDVLDKKDGDAFRKKADCLQNAIYTAYADENSLTGMAALEYFGIANRVDEIEEYLANNDYQPHVGILGNKFLLDVLGKAGKTETIYKYLTRSEYPSFGYWYRQGQTALCEDFELTNSLNHHMYSPVAETMLKYMAGIIVGKGLMEFVIAPHIPEGETYVKAYIDTPCGRLSVSAVKTDAGVEVQAEVPYGVKAVLAATDELLPCGISQRLLNDWSK
jgi:alpha-L-rhamnosidase